MLQKLKTELQIQKASYIHMKVLDRKLQRLDSDFIKEKEVLNEQVRTFVIELIDGKDPRILEIEADNVWNYVMEHIGIFPEIEVILDQAETLDNEYKNKIDSLEELFENKLAKKIDSISAQQKGILF